MVGLLILVLILGLAWLTTTLLIEVDKNDRLEQRNHTLDVRNDDLEQMIASLKGELEQIRLLHEYKEKLRAMATTNVPSLGVKKAKAKAK